MSAETVLGGPRSTFEDENGVHELCFKGDGNGSSNSPTQPYTREKATGIISQNRDPGHMTSSTKGADGEDNIGRHGLTFRRRYANLKPTEYHPLKVAPLTRKGVRFEPVLRHPLNNEDDIFPPIGALSPPISYKEARVQLQHRKDGEKRKSSVENAYWAPYQERKGLRRMNGCHNSRDLRGRWIFSEAVGMALRQVTSPTSKLRMKPF